ncbi:DNA helicase, partial [Tanacetum coccineum]
DGNIGTLDVTAAAEDTFNIDIPKELCIPDSDTALDELINFIYDGSTFQTPNADNLQMQINARVLTLLNTESRIYPSSDEAIPHGNDGGETELLYPTEYLKSLNLAGLPPHRLELKVGAPIILLRNLNITGGLCNGTRMIVTQLLSKGNAIQANMNLNDINQFDELLQLNNTYRISRFRCMKTQSWDRTLPNNTTLLFGKYTSIIPISNADFPEHHFNFIAYNEVAKRATVSGAPLTGGATSSRRTRRIIDIQNLDGMNLPFLIWGEMADKFDMDEYENLQKPVIMAVSSAWANKRYGVEGQTYIFQYRFGKKARSGYPNFTLDAVLKSTGPALLALPSTETIASPAAEVMDVPTSSNTSASDTKKDNMKDQTDNPEGKKTSVKRGLFQETETGAKKPRQDK